MKGIVTAIREGETEELNMLLEKGTVNIHRWTLSEIAVGYLLYGRIFNTVWIQGQYESQRYWVPQLYKTGSFSSAESFAQRRYGYIRRGDTISDLLVRYSELVNEERHARKKAREIALSFPDGYADPALVDSTEYAKAHMNWNLLQNRATRAFWAIPEEFQPIPFWNKYNDEE